MTCDPKELVKLAKCMVCIPRNMRSAVKLYLLCQWLKKKANPVAPFSYSPSSAIITWYDAPNPGGASGTLADFNSTADIPSVTGLVMSGLGLTSISNLSSLPNLVNFTASFNALTTVDVSGNNLLQVAQLESNNLTIASVNAILIDLASHSVYSGNLALFSQTPSAPPSGLGIVAKTKLLNSPYGWSVGTD